MSPADPKARALVAPATEARKNGNHYGGFHVGAVGSDEEGRVYHGANLKPTKSAAPKCAEDFVFDAVEAAGRGPRRAGCRWCPPQGGYHTDPPLLRRAVPAPDAQSDSGGQGSKAHHPNRVRQHRRLSRRGVYGREPNAGSRGDTRRLTERRSKFEGAGSESTCPFMHFGIGYTYMSTRRLIYPSLARKLKQALFFSLA